MITHSQTINAIDILLGDHNPRGDMFRNGLMDRLGEFHKNLARYRSPYAKVMRAILLAIASGILTFRRFIRLICSKVEKLQSDQKRQQEFIFWAMLLKIFTEYLKDYENG